MERETRERGKKDTAPAETGFLMEDAGREDAGDLEAMWCDRSWIEIELCYNSNKF